MNNKICLFVCDFLSPEVSKAVQVSGYLNVKIIVYKHACNTTALDLSTINSLIEKHEQEFSKFLFIGSSCLSLEIRKALSERHVTVVLLKECFEILLNKEIAYHYIQKGYYLITPVWLKNYKKNIDDWGFNSSTVKTFLGESVRKILLLDTGVIDNLTEELNALADYTALPCEVLPVGLSYCQNLIDNIILKEIHDIENHEITKQISELTRERADYSTIFDYFATLDYTDEQKIVEKIFMLMDILFMPQEIVFDKYRNGIHKEKICLRGVECKFEKDEKCSFKIEVSDTNEILGIFTIFNVKFNKFIEQYKDMGQVLKQFCALAIANARKFEIILEQKERIKEYSEELAKINQGKDKFLSILAHDLRSPFNGFLGITEMMADNDIPPDKMHMFAQELHKSAQAVYELLENLLSWSQLQLGILNPVIENLSVKDLVDNVLFSIKKIAKEKDIDIITSIPSTLLINSDGKMIESVLRNLASNAIKFTNRGGKIEIKAMTDDEKNILFEVNDTGVGINTAAIEKIFLLDAGKGELGTEGESSSGFGLILCKEFVKQHGGEIWVESELGKGSSFYFTIPRKLEVS